MDWGISIFYYIVTVVVVLIYGLLLYAFIAKTMARVQGRVGIPIYQPFLDIIQTYNKRTAVTHGVMFDLGPVFRLAGGLGTLAFIPVITRRDCEVDFGPRPDAAYSGARYWSWPSRHDRR